MPAETASADPEPAATPPGGLNWRWALLLLPLAALLIGAVVFDRESWPGLVGDEATYLMAAESLAWDLDLYFTEADYERFVDHWGTVPDGLILQSGDDGRSLAYGKPFFYPLVIAPFVRLAPMQGAFVANALLLACAALLAARSLGRRLGAAAPLWTAAFVFASVAFAYVFWAHADLFLMAAVAVALALLFGSEAEEPRKSLIARYAAVGALLALVAFSRPFYLTLFLPAVLKTPPRRRRTAVGALLGAALLLAALASTVHLTTGGSWSGYGGERRAFYSYTGFPAVDYPASRWPQLLEESGNAAWAEVESPLEPISTSPRLFAWNTLYFFAGRHVGLLPYFLPVVLALLGRPKSPARWALLAAAAGTAVAFFLYRPFNFYGGGAAIANRYFLPLYPAFWFLLERRPRDLWPKLAILAAAPFLFQLWLAPGAPPRSAETGFTHVSRLAARLLPFETTQSHLQPSGERDLVHNGLWMRFLTPGLSADAERERLYAKPGRTLELVIGSAQSLGRLELRLFDPAAPRPKVGRATVLEEASTSRALTIDPGWAAASHPMWWTDGRYRLYRLRLRWPDEAKGPVPFTLASAGGASRGVILISIDTLGADHLGAYGYERDTSPFFDSLAARGVLFENAFAQYPSTLVSHLSMFTGLYPQEHAVYPPAKVLAEEIEMLPERFRTHGFRTAGFTEGGFVARRFGFHRGFDEFSDPRIRHDTDVEQTLARGVDYLERLAPDDRFFLFLHTYTAHDPYEPPPPWDTLFWPGEPPDVFKSSGKNLGEVNAGSRSLDPDGLEYFRAMYDGSVRYLDEVLRGFFDELEALGVLADTTVVITSDHGEAFLEHGKVGHSQVYPESLRVPLLVLQPRAQPRRVATPVALVDLPPTLYELAGIPPAEGLSGVSLVGHLAGRGGAAELQAYGEVVESERQYTLVASVGGGVYQVVSSALPGEEDGTWVTRSAAFDVVGAKLEAQAVSFAEPRELEVRVDGERRAPIVVGTTWQPLELELGADGERHRVELSTAGCDSPLALPLGEDPRCLSFKLRGPALRRLELFRLDTDAVAARDLSRERPELLRELGSRLQALEWTARAAPQESELDHETLEALRALGYVD